MKSKLLLVMVVAMAAITACDDDTQNIGTSLVNSVDSLKISADTFIVTTRSIVADSVLSRSSKGYLGRVKDPETGAYVSGSFMTQFHTMENYELPKADSIMSKNSKGEIIADSAEIRLYYSSYYGDSLNTMKLTAYELSKPAEEGNRYYSNFDPESDGYVRSDGIAKDKVFSLVDYTIKDSIRYLSTYSPNIRIPLNEAYTDKDGNTYNNYGTYILRKFYQNKNNFKNSYNFIHNVCPGFYFKTKNSLGSMIYVYVSQLNIYFKYKENDTVYVGTSSFSGTEEVLQTTKITNDTKTIQKLANDQSCTYLKTPAGLFTEITLPVDDILKGHEKDTLSTAKVIFTRINNSTQNSYNLPVPNYLLMLPKDSLYSFFENAEITDNENSFLTKFSSSSDNYTFSNFSNIIVNMNKKRLEGMKGDALWETKHPEWNKIVVIPVDATYVSSSSSYYTSSTTTLTKIEHDMGLTSTRLVGGTNNARTPIKISVIYSKFNSK
jgi:hypothetical protein